MSFPSIPSNASRSGQRLGRATWTVHWRGAPAEEDVTRRVMENNFASCCFWTLNYSRTFRILTFSQSCNFYKSCLFVFQLCQRWSPCCCRWWRRGSLRGSRRCLWTRCFSPALQSGRWKHQRQLGNIAARSHTWKQTEMNLSLFQILEDSMVFTLAGCAITANREFWQPCANAGHLKKRLKNLYFSRCFYFVLKVPRVVPIHTPGGSMSVISPEYYKNMLIFSFYWFQSLSVACFTASLAQC